MKQAAANKYILDSDGRPVAEEDLLVWAEWIERSDKQRIIEKTAIADCTVSTVFLGLDYSFGDDSGIPILYETMIFGGNLDGQMRRYSTREEAEEGHRDMCRLSAADQKGHLTS